MKMIVTLHDKQKEIVRSIARFKITRAGRRGGKSTGEIEQIVYKAVQKDKNRVLYLAPTQKQARAIIWEQLKSRLAGIGNANESRLEMSVPTMDGGTAIIYVGGWENRENYRGMKFHHITFDELDTLKDFFIGWQEIFRPALTDTAGTANFIGTPKKENQNLRRLEKVAEKDIDYECFHFTTYDNPHVPDSEINKAKQELDADTFKQEYLAEYVDNVGALFKYDAIIDLFTNTTDEGKSYLIVDIADDGSDATVFSLWNGLSAVKVIRESGLRTHDIIEKIREYTRDFKVPMSQVAVDAIGVGAGVASSPLLEGIIGYKGSYAAIKTEVSIIEVAGLRTVHPRLVSDYSNLRSQCMFKLAELVNSRQIAVETEDSRIKESIIEELTAYQDASRGDGKAKVTSKEDVKSAIGHSPDITDTLQMRMFFEIRKVIDSNNTPEFEFVKQQQQAMMRKTRNDKQSNSTQ